LDLVTRYYSMGTSEGGMDTVLVLDAFRCHLVREPMGER
jgi:hypothetical protein